MPSIGLSGVALRRANQPVLEHVTVAVDAGEVVVITAGRGTGKSSLLAVAAGVLRPDAGQVVAGGRSIVDLQNGSLPYLRRYIGYLPLNPPFLEEETPLENLMLALAVRGTGPETAASLAAEALAELGLALPPERPVARLSAAERRLVALARVLCGPPPVLVLDDPTPGIDSPDRLRVLRALERVRALGSAILCASSDPDFVSALAGQGARVLELRGGRVVGGPAGIHLVGSDETVENTDVTLQREAR